MNSLTNTCHEIQKTIFINKSFRRNLLLAFYFPAIAVAKRFLRTLVHFFLIKTFVLAPVRLEMKLSILTHAALYLYLFKFTVRHGFKHFPRDTMAREVRCVVLRFCFGKYVVNITVTLL